MPTLDSIALDLPRKIVIKQFGRTYAAIVSPISEPLWLKYFDGLISTAERVGKEVVQRIDATSAGIELVDSVAQFVEGYEADPPLGHRLAVANVLTSAFVPDQDMQGFGQIPLVAIWSANEGGSMRRHKDLIHTFKEPTAEQNRRYRRDDSRSQIVGGSRKGMTVYHGAQRALAGLYDELIVSVEGYVVNGVPLEGSEAIARHMDTYHKVAAAMQLFAPVLIDVEEED